MLVKELAALSGVKKKTIDSYLGTKNYSPSVENAVSIARVLGVSVEYLMTGKNAKVDMSYSVLPDDIKEIVTVLRKLKPKDRYIILNLSQILKNSSKNNTSDFPLSLVASTPSPPYN